MKSISNKEKPTTSEWVKSSAYSLVDERDIAIYNMGKERGEADFLDKWNKIINENLAKAYGDTTQVISKIKDNGIEIISARLRIETPKEFKIIIPILSSDGISDRLRPVYEFICELEDKINSDNYNVDFSIAKCNDASSDVLVEGDGFIYKHALLINA